MDDLDLLSQMEDPMAGRGPPPGYHNYSTTSGGPGYPGAGSSSYYYGADRPNIGVQVEPQMVNGRLVINMPPPSPPSRTQPLLGYVAAGRDLAIEIEEDAATSLNDSEAEAHASANRGNRAFIATFAVTFLIALPVSYLVAKRFV